MYSLLLIALLSGSCFAASVNKHTGTLDNRIDLDDVPTKHDVETRRLRIMEKPAPVYYHNAGDHIHLTCEALGAPAPSIHWFRNDAPVFEYDMESHDISNGNVSSVARLSSTLIVSRASVKDVYTCLVTSGKKVARITSVVYSMDGSTEVSERTKLYPLAPQIVVYYKVYVNTIGKTITVPCRAKGHPRPKIIWTDNNGADIKNDPRFKVLRSGELVISSLRWSDMGEWSCRAANMFGDMYAVTFIYPARAV